jgi:hypothetical protein
VLAAAISIPSIAVTASVTAVVAFPIAALAFDIVTAGSGRRAGSRSNLWFRPAFLFASCRDWLLGDE